MGGLITSNTRVVPLPVILASWMTFLPSPDHRIGFGPAEARTVVADVAQLHNGSSRRAADRRLRSRLGHGPRRRQ